MTLDIINSLGVHVCGILATFLVHVCGILAIFLAHVHCIIWNPHVSLFHMASQVSFSCRWQSCSSKQGTDEKISDAKDYQCEFH